MRDELLFENGADFACCTADRLYVFCSENRDKVESVRRPDDGDPSEHHVPDGKLAIAVGTQ